MTTDRDESPPRPSGYRFLFSPKWIAFHLLIVVLVVTMINLGLWQLRRLDQRRHFNSEVRANLGQPVADLGGLLPLDGSRDEWRRVTVTGTYLEGHEFLVVNRSQDGDVGRNVVDALQLDDSSLLLVNRGFLPVDDPVPPLPDGRVTIEGRLRAGEHRRIGQPSDKNEPGLTEIHRVDVELLSKQFDQTLQPMYVEQLAPPKPFEEITAPDTSDEGPHLSYAIQWFAFTACAIVGWILAIRRSMGIRSGKVSKRKPSYIPIADEESVP